MGVEAGRNDDGVRREADEPWQDDELQASRKMVPSEAGASGALTIVP